MSTGKSPVTSFDVIEGEKENIVPLRNGRSAAALSKSLRDKADTGSSSKIAETRLQFEKRILQDLEELDDPLELYTEYINWINNAYPQGGQSKQSGMLSTLERCLMYFQDFETYKNDPRYLKLWLWYLQLFTGSANERQSLYVYMMRKQIGSCLTLFYESLASFLQDRNEHAQARVVLLKGIENGARPLARLRRTLAQFDEHIQSMDLKIPTLKSGESILDQEGPDIILGRGRDQIEETNSNKQTWHTSSMKQTIFKDTSDGDFIQDLRKDGWDYLEGKKQRNKENETNKRALEAGTNIGTIEQVDSAKVSGNRLPVFKDSIGRSGPIYKVLEIAGRKPEKIDCNFDLIYPSAHQEFCIEELIAISRNAYYRKSRKRTVDNTAEDSNSVQALERPVKQTKLVLREKTLTSGALSDELSKESRSTEKSPKEQYKRVERISIMPLKDDATEQHSIHKKSAPNSPTMTVYSKDAINEVYSMFNQNYSEPKKLLDNDDTTSKFAMFENFTQEFTRKNMDDLTEVKQFVPEDTITKTPVRQNASNEDSILERSAAKGSVTPSYKSKLQEYMTPIEERTESTFKLASNKGQEHASEAQGIDTMPNTAESSPFLTQPQNINVPQKIEPAVITDPLSDETRATQLNNIKPPLTEYRTFYRYNQPLKMSALLKKIHTVSKNANKNPIVDFKKTNDLYCIRSQLGEGGYATVYLAESSTGSLKALKVEKPASIWEFYILKQVETRLVGQPILASIINVDSLHCFEDESYLVLNYASQGTVLDLINLEKERNGGPLDETLCMYFAIELLKVLESIHEVGIVHGDLKPDNCMLRFEESSEPLSKYNPNGEGGWNGKGIYLIDFGRSFDMTLFPPGTKFRANWRTDQQDCPEMREGRPWTYEADYYGLAGIIHAMLFGKFIETRLLPNHDYTLTNSFKRYWRQDIWSPLFDLLINSGRYEELPMTSRIREHRMIMEASLEESSNRLRSQVLSLESDLLRLRK